MSRPRAFFYSHDAYGLGHIRRTLRLATELAHRRQDATLLVASGSPRADALAADARIPGLDVLRLPDATRGLLYGDLPGDHALGLPWTGVWPLRAAILAATGRVFAPHLVHVDQAPAGYLRELAAALDGWTALPPDARPRLLLGLRDIPDEPWAPRRTWDRDGAHALLDRAYDRILVYGDARICDVREVYGFSDHAAAKTTFCGYLAPPAPVVSAGAIRARLGIGAQPMVVVTTGGGADGTPLLRAALGALREPALTGIAAFVVAGPLLEPATAHDLALEAARLPDVAFVPSVPNVIEHVAAADAVVTMGGYNALTEAVALGKRPVVVPRVRPNQPPGEQQVRAERFAALGLAAMIHPSDLTPRLLAESIRAELDAGSSPPPILDFGGRDRAGALLADALAT